MSHLKFRKSGNVVFVRTNKGELLGSIEKYLKWKELIFVPMNKTIWSSGCLEEIICKMKQLNKKRDLR